MFTVIVNWSVVILEMFSADLLMIHFSVEFVNEFYPMQLKPVEKIEKGKWFYY